MVAGIAGCSSKKSGKTLRIAAAADLARAFEEVGKAFEAKTHIKPIFNFGSSGLLATQISQGAPYFLYAAANRGYAQKAIDSGNCDPDSAKLYARGRVVVWSPKGVEAPKTLADLADARFRKIAIANPQHAPYGQAAQQALEKAGVWPQVKDRMVLAENVQATMLYARDKNADAGLVALSLAVVTDGGSFLPIDPSLHDSLDQTLVVCGKGEEADAARKFAAFVESKEGREIMTRYGFLLPGEKMAGPPPPPSK